MTRKTTLVIVIILIVLLGYFGWRHFNIPQTSNSDVRVTDSLKAAQEDSSKIKPGLVKTSGTSGSHFAKIDSTSLTTTTTGVLFGKDPSSACMGRGICNCVDAPVSGSTIPTNMTYDGNTLMLTFSQADINRIQPEHRTDFDGPTYTFDAQWNIPPTLQRTLRLPAPAVSAGIAYKVDNSTTGIHVLSIPMH
jgi:hypothetical protein